VCGYFVIVARASPLVADGETPPPVHRRFELVDERDREVFPRILRAIYDNF